MIIGASAITATAAFIAFSYWRSKNNQQPPEVRISDVHDDAGPTRTESATDKAPGTDQRDDESSYSPTAKGLLAPQSPNTTPKQNPQSDKKLMPPPPLPNGTLSPSSAKPSSSLMPPPSRPNPKIPKPRASPTSLQPPPSTASTLRAPPTHTPHRNSAFAPSTSTLPPKSRPSRKVLLAPGHSPLDWAALIRSPPSPTFLRGSDVPPFSLIRVTPSMLKAHNGRKGTNPWGVFGGKVYNMGPYVDFHPGGKGEILRAAGNMEGERLFREVHPWVSWENMLGECCVGVLVEEGEGGEGEGEMDEMD